MPTTTPAEILSTVEVEETSVEQEHEVVKNIVEVSSDNTFVLPTNISVSLPVSGNTAILELKIYGNSLL